MVNFSVLDSLNNLYGIDFEKDSFPAVLEKLAASGMTSFRLNWRPDVVVCVAFTVEGGKALNGALDGYLEKLENQ